MNNIENRVEALGPAEKIINTLVDNIDHMVHNRPGIVTQDRRVNVGVRWSPVTHKKEGGQSVVYRLDKVGNKTRRTRIGVKGDDNIVRANGRVVGEYRKPGIFPEVATYLYKKIAEIYEMDNEFVARWASWAMNQDHRDLKVVLAAFSLVQSRKGDPVRQDGKVLFFDEDYRDVGEAMCLIRRRGKDLDSKLLLRVGDVLRLPQIAQINRELGFGNSARNAAMGRYNKVVTKWLRYREQNPRMLTGLVRSGQRKNVMKLCQRVGFKPESPEFFKTLRWKQKQAEDGRRTMLIGEAVRAAETWAGLTEREICERIVREKIGLKRINGLLGTTNVGLTRAIMGAAIQAGSLSDADLIIMTPTLEELGLLKVPAIKNVWDAATLRAKNQRARNIARNVKNKEVVEALNAGADVALQKKVEDKVRNLRIYFVVDKSASMGGAIEKAKRYLSVIIQSFPLDKVHVSIFNTVGRMLRIRDRSAAGVAGAFHGHKAAGGTNYGAGVNAFRGLRPRADEDAIMIFVGDQANGGRQDFSNSVRQSGINPVAFGLINVVGSMGHQGNCVRLTAQSLNIPCLEINENTFDDPYAVGRTLSHLIDSVPVGAAGAVANRRTLIDKILETELLSKPAWA